MEQKLYIVYCELTQDVYYRSVDDGMRKNDIYWYGFDEKEAVRKFREYSRCLGGEHKAHIKCFDLASAPEVISASKLDEQINILNSTVLNHFKHKLLVRCSANQKSNTVTVGLTTKRKDGQELDHYDRDSRKSFIHKKYEVPAKFQESWAYFNILEILADKYFTNAELVVPVKVKIDGKDYKTYKPTK